MYNRFQVFGLTDHISPLRSLDMAYDDMRPLAVIDRLQACLYLVALQRFNHSFGILQFLITQGLLPIFVRMKWKRRACKELTYAVLYRLC